MERGGEAEELEEPCRGDHVVGGEDDLFAYVGHVLQRGLVGRQARGHLVVVPEYGVHAGIDFAAVGAEVSGEDFKKGALSAAVGADDPEARPLDEFKAVVLEDLLSATADGYVPEFEYLLAHAAADAGKMP